MKKLNENEIYSTKDYSSFIIDKRNRSLKSKGRKYDNLKKSIQKFGLISPVIVDQNFVVVDGQHRLEICKELSLPVQYISRQDSAAALITLNNDRLNWQVMDYAVHYKGNPSYQKVLSYLDETKLSLNAIHCLLKGKEIDPEVFKNGKFRITTQEERRYRKNLPVLLSLINIDEGRHKKALSKTRAISALAELITHPKYSHSHFTNKLRATTRIVSVGTKNDAASTFQELYNKNLGKEKRINLGVK